MTEPEPIALDEHAPIIEGHRWNDRTSSMKSDSSASLIAAKVAYAGAATSDRERLSDAMVEKPHQPYSSPRIKAHQRARAADL